MDRLAAMQAFASVVEPGSFTRAAGTVQLGRATVTALVQLLEAHLRVRLLHLTTRKVVVTREGADYYRKVLRLLADLDEAEASVASATAQPRGRLRIDVPSPFARLLLVPALPDFQARFPEIRLDIGVSVREVDVIGDNVDCVIRGGVPSDQALVARHLGDLQFGLHAAPAYLQRVGAPVHPQELEGPLHESVGFLNPRSGRPRRFQLRRGSEVVELEGRCRLALDDGNAYLAAGLAGLGVVCVPDYMAAPHEARGELVRLLADWQLPAMPLHLMYPPNRHASQRLRVFIDWVAGLLGPAPG